MASTRRVVSDLVAPRAVTDLVFSEDGLAGRIHNMVVTDDGTLRTVVGPCEYVPSDYEDQADFGSPLFERAGVDQACWGVTHGLITGRQRSVLLAHAYDNVSDGGGIWEFRGWNIGVNSTWGWTELIGPTVAAEYQISLPLVDEAGFLTQFVPTPMGIVIVPQGSRAFFYDGEVVAPLGYDRAPGTPQGHGPSLAQVDSTVASTTDNMWAYDGYSYAGRNQPRAFGFNRVGTLQHQALAPGTAPEDSNPLGGILQKTTRRAKVQFIDLWGNLSPASPASEAVVLPKEDNLSTNRNLEEEPVEALRKQILWSSIATGRDGTVGRKILLTKNLEVSGDPLYYEASGDSSVMLTSFATIPNNTQDLWPDNIEDGWLFQVEREVDPVPMFRLAEVAMGRLWVANWPGGEGFVRPSLPGRYGTFGVNEEILPDPAGGEITGLLRVQAGLIVCTELSSFIIEPNDNGDGFRARTLNATAGCVSPNTMATLPSGIAIWLGREGFYASDGSNVKLISQDINKAYIRRINRGRWRRACAAVDTRSKEYRCWVPLSGSSTNNLCLVFDGQGWRTRDDVVADAVCVTRDHRAAMLAAGTVNVTGTESQGSEGTHYSLWVLDHETLAYKDQPAPITAVFETAWLRGASSADVVTFESVDFWLRATSSADGTVEVYRDWLEYPVHHTRDDVKLMSPNDPQTLWGTAALDGTYNDALRSKQAVPYAWTTRRPYWFKVDTSAYGAETIRVSLQVTGDLDVVGLRFQNLVPTQAGTDKPSWR